MVSTMKLPSKVWSSILISNLDSSKTLKKSSSKKVIPNSPTNSPLTKTYKLGEWSSNSNSTKEDSINSLRLSTKSERETSLLFILLKNTKIKTDTLSRPFLKKPLTVKKKEKNASSRKFKS